MSGRHLFSDRHFRRPLRQAPPNTIAPPGQPPPPPQVIDNPPGLFGLGIGGGVGLGPDSDSARGVLQCFVGLAPALTGTISINFPVLGTLYWVSAEWASLNIGVGAGDPMIIHWTAYQPLVTSSRPLLIAYQWLVAD